MNETTQFDAIVVGSGITGGWAAKELTEKGLKVLMLERGREVVHGRDYVTENSAPWQLPLRNLPQRERYATDYPIQSRARGFDSTNVHFWNNDRENPYVQAPGKPFNWLRAGVVGGRSLLWGRQCYRWSDLDFEANKRDGHGNDWPVRYADISPWYSYVERFIGVSGEPLGLSQLPDGEFQPAMQLNVVEKVFKTAVERQYGDRRVTIGRIANLTAPLEGRAPCQNRNHCSRGCSWGGYFSTQSSTLPAATKTGNLTLRADSVVESLEYDAATGRIAAVRVVDAKTKARTRYTAKLVFLCASAYASTHILLNSRSEQFPNGLANKSDALGRYVMDHVHGQGAAAVMSGYEHKYYRGNRSNTLYIPRFRNVSESSPDFHRGYGYQGLAAPSEWNTKWSAVPGFGADFKRSLRQPGQWMLFLLAFAECLPYADNRVVLDAQVDRFGIPQLRFEVTYRENERRLGKDAIEQAIEMMKAAGGKNIQALETPWTPGTSIHEFGGARMGTNPAESVLNGWNQAHDVPNLFVTDGACMASSSCVNPSLTFMALTARAADYAVARLKSDGQLSA